MSESVLVVSDLRKSFRGIEVLKGISFELKRSEIIGLIGPNGAGKTTILHILIGLITPDSGSVNIFGMDINNHKNREIILKKMNFSSTYISLPFSLTVEEALNVFSRLYGIKCPSSKIQELSKGFGLSDLLKKEIRTLSSGQQTRLNLAKAFINDPEILLLDEPTASLDPDVAEKTRSFIKDVISNRKISIIYTSHNMGEMEEMADRVIFLNEGRVMIQGSVSDVVSRFKGKSLEDVFIKVARKETYEH